MQKLAKEMVLEVPFSSQATAHGVRYEPEARAKFEEERCVKVHQFGLVVMPEDPWLGCSPDGLFRYVLSWNLLDSVRIAASGSLCLIFWLA